MLSWYWIFSNTKEIRTTEREAPRKHLWFITPNYFEHLNGVSTKYLSLFRSLDQSDLDWDLQVFHTGLFRGERFQRLQTHACTGFSLPFYPEIKIPLYLPIHASELQPGDYYLIIFHSEFVWLYPQLTRLFHKKDPNVRLLLIPNLHTDYDTYLQHYLQKIESQLHLQIGWITEGASLHRMIDQKIEEGLFSHMLVTGSGLQKRFERVRSFNANEIDVDAFQRFWTPISRRGTLHIFYCGRLSVEKNLFTWCDLCVALYQLYFQKRRGSMRLHLIGDGPIRAELEEYLQKKFGGGRDPSLYHFYGSLSHSAMGEVYQRFDHKIFLFTSQSETFGKTCMEAMVCGLPIFLLRSPVADALYTDGKNAFLFDVSYDQPAPSPYRGGAKVDSVAEWIQKYQRFLEMSPGEVRRLEKRMKRLTEEYDQKKIFQDWIQFFQMSFEIDTSASVPS